MINLNSKSVLITGGSRGIGAACVKLFAFSKPVKRKKYSFIKWILAMKLILSKE